MKKKGWISW